MPPHCKGAGIELNSQPMRACSSKPHVLGIGLHADRATEKVDPATPLLPHIMKFLDFTALSAP